MSNLEQNTYNFEIKDYFLSSWILLYEKIEGDFSSSQKENTIKVLETYGKQHNIKATEVESINQNGSIISLEYKKLGQIKKLNINIDTLHISENQSQKKLEQDYVRDTSKLKLNIAIIKYLFAKSNADDTFWSNAYLDEDDILTETDYNKNLASRLDGTKLEGHMKGKTIKQIHKETIQLLGEIMLKYDGADFGDPDMKQKLENMKEELFEISMGIGPKYKQGAKHFENTERSLDTFINEIFEEKGFIDSFKYLDKLIKQTRANEAKTRANNQLESLIIQKAGQKIFDKLRAYEYRGEMTDKKRDVLKNNYLLLAKMLTGRASNIDPENKNPVLASKVLLQAMQLQGGLIDKLEATNAFSFRIVDPKIKGRTPTKVIDDCLSKLGGDKEQSKAHLMQFFGDIFSIPEGLSYQDLTLEQKQNISFIARLEEKSGELKTIMEEGKDPKKIQEKIGKITGEIYSESIQAIQDSINKHFKRGGLYSKGVDDSNVQEDFGIVLDKYNNQILDVYNDIEGNEGWWRGDLTDETKKTIDTFGKALPAMLASIAIILAISAANAASGGALTPVQIAVVSSIGGTIAGRVFYKQGYDSRKEWYIDVGTDLVVNGLQAGAAEKFLFKGAMTTGKAALYTGLDLTSGFGVEIARDAIFMEQMFGGNPLIPDK